MTASPIDLLREHGALNSSVAARLAADARITSAKATLLKALGLGGLLFGLGAGIGLGCFGYSYMMDMGSQAQKIADIVAKTVAQTEIKATGTVAVAPDGQVTLASGGRVALEPGGTVTMDPSSTVKAIGQPTIAMPAPLAPQPPAPVVAPVTPSVPGSRASGTPDPYRPGPYGLPLVVQAGEYSKAPDGAVRTSLVVEKAVMTQSGQVITQWTYDQPSDPAPRRQFCYKPAGSFQNADERDRLTIIGIDGQPYGQSDSQALLNCMWFKASLPG
jgi:hypothetical protein